MNKKIKKYLDEITKTEKKIADLQQYLRGVQAALKQEEDNEMIRCIRGMKMDTVDPEKTVSAKNNVGAMATILILALGGVAAYYYFKIYKPKKEEEDDQPEGLETGDLETVEDDEELDDEPEDFEDSEK